MGFKGLLVHEQYQSKTKLVNRFHAQGFNISIYTKKNSDQVLTEKNQRKVVYFGNVIISNLYKAELFNIPFNTSFADGGDLIFDQFVIPHLLIFANSEVVYTLT